MKGVRAAQDQGVSIYYEGHLHGENFGYVIMLGGYGFGFAMPGQNLFTMTENTDKSPSQT